MNETHRRAYFGMALALMAGSEFENYSPTSGRCSLSGEDASRRAIGLNDYKKLGTRKQRMKEAMRRAAMGKK